MMSLSLLAIAGITDFLDGFIARKYNSKTAIGSALDPAADKFLMATLTVSLCSAKILPLPLAVVIIGRDVGLLVWSALVRYQTLPPPKTFSRYWNISIPSVEVKSPVISKVNTVMQLGLMAASLIYPVGFIPDLALQSLQF
ncbi:hypothetical protein HK096_008055, partial [Nowakowskiella sp. JEL0078]